MLSPGARRRRLATVSTVLGALLSLFSAFMMRDHVRLVEIVELFFGGVGTGAGLAGLLAQHRRATADSSD
jgi:hypothetical protein